MLTSARFAVELVSNDLLNSLSYACVVAVSQMQKQHFSDKIGHLVIYTALVVYTFKFTFLYFKRVLRMAFLTIISPIVALTYPIDKMEGQAKGFQMWLKEYTYNALLQPMHYILYYILVSSSLSLAAHNPIYGIAALMFISQAENLLKRIFGFDKARAGTVQGLTGAFATGAITSSLNKYVKDPMHPFGLGKGNSGSGKSGGSGKGSSRSQQLTNGNYMDSEKVNYKEDVVGDDALLQALGIESGANSEQQNTPNSSEENSTTMAAAVIGAATDSESLENIPEISQMPELAQLLAFMESSGMVNTPEERNAVISEYLSQQNGSPLVSYFDKFFTRYRKQLPISVSELGGLSYDTDETGSFEDILGMLADYKRTGKNSGAIPLLKNLSYEQLKNLLRSRIDENESEFIENNIPLQYVDGDSRTSSQLLEEIMRLNELSTDISLPSNERNKYAKQSQKLLKKLKRRMAQNEYIKRNGGVLKLRKQEAERISDLVTSYQLSDIDIIGVFNPDMLINGIPITEYIALKNEYKQKQSQVIEEKGKKENKTKVELGSKEQIVQNEQQVQAEIISEQEENEYGVIEQPKLRNIFGLKRGRIQTKPKLVQDPIERAGLQPQKLGKDVDSKLVLGEEELSQRTIPGLGHRRISGLKRNMLQMLNGTIIQSPEERAGQVNQQEQGRYETTEEIPTNEIGRGLILGTTSGLGKRTLLRMSRKLVQGPDKSPVQEQKGTIIQTPEERLKQSIEQNSNQGAADGYAIDNSPIMLPRRRVRREKTIKDLKRGLINQYERKQLQEPRGKLIGEPEERTTQQQPKGRLAQELENRKVQELKRSLYQNNGNTSTDTGVEENKKPTLAQILEQKQKHKEERKQKIEQSWKEFNEKPITKGVKNVVSDMRKGAIKPLWDEEKDVEYNVERLAGNVIKGVAGATLGIAAAAVQAGISITDGKYSIKEGMATFGAGMAGASNIVNASGRKLDELRRDQYSLERYSHEWYNRDDIISEYNREYPGQGKAMRRRAVNNYVSRGVTDVKEQKQAMKFAELLKKERGLNEEEADKIAVATLQYKKGLTRNSDYMVLFDEKRRDKYLDTKVDAYSGAASKDAIRRLHLDLIENVRDFDKVNE